MTVTCDDSAGNPFTCGSVAEIEQEAALFIRQSPSGDDLHTWMDGDSRVVTVEPTFPFPSLPLSSR